MYRKISAFVSRAAALGAVRPNAVTTDQSLDFLTDEAYLETSDIPVSQKPFRRILCRERKRAERSHKSFVLMLVRTNVAAAGKGESTPAMSRAARVLSGAIRETDTLGWFEAHSTLGVIFSELGAADVTAALTSIESKVIAALQRAFIANQLEKFELSFYTFPNEPDDEGSHRTFDPVLHPDLINLDHKKRASLVVKRIMDVVGSGVALFLLAPVFLVLAAFIKLSSKGPVFFRQERLGQFEIPFVFLKFRSMHTATDPEIHKEYVRNFIAGRAGSSVSSGNPPIYKIMNDPRVTWIGRFMRRTSLDELPQFWNVLVGEMSLVGPRPPIRYETEAYDVWHRRRLLEAKPGITGLWQVHGRSKTTFDEMVRLDLRYSRTWSPLLDVKILLRTPRAVFSGDGAY